MPSPTRPRRWLTLLSTLALALPAAAQQADVRLPDLGSSAGTVLTPQEAAQYGGQFLRELRAAKLVLDDPQVQQYLHALGYRLASASADPGQHYTFTALNIPEINAFATFGGYVFVFSGMFTLTENQDQLAAVLAHELAHISQQHLQRAIEDQSKSAPLYVLGAFAAALAASRVDAGSRTAVTRPYAYGYGGGAGSPYPAGPDASIGAFYSVLALMQQHQIEFTRKDESEADHVGIQTLAKSGFDPIGMATVFAHMQAVLRPGGDGGMAAGNAPDFLQDHPVSSVRIADARARARVLEQQVQVRRAAQWSRPLAPGMLPLPFVKHAGSLAEASSHGPSELQYALMRERVRVLSTASLRKTLDYYTGNLASSPTFSASPANRYGYALALLQNNQAEQALPVMRELVAARPGDLTLALGLADAEYHAGQRDAALHRYATLNTLWPNDPAIVLAYSRSLLDANRASGAKLAQSLLKPLLDDDSTPALYEQYGHACLIAGDEVHAGIAYADATFLSGRAVDALDQLHRLLQRKDLDYYTRAQIDARIEQITPIVLEIRRRRLGNPDAPSLTGVRLRVDAGACDDLRCNPH